MERLLIAVVLIAAVSGCAEVNLATDYVGNEPQSFATDIPGLEIETLRVYRDARHAGKLWVQPNAGHQMSMAFAGRQTQFTAMLSSTVEPAYRAAAVAALRENPGGSCEVGAGIPWPTQFAIEFAYTCGP